MPAKRRGCALHVLRLPCRALGAFAHDQSHRINLQHGPSSNPPDEGVRLTYSRSHHGIQTGHRCGETLAPTQGLQAHHPGHRGGCGDHAHFFKRGTPDGQNRSGDEGQEGSGTGIHPASRQHMARDSRRHATRPDSQDEHFHVQPATVPVHGGRRLRRGQSDTRVESEIRRVRAWLPIRFRRAEWARRQPGWIRSPFRSG